VLYAIFVLGLKLVKWDAPTHPHREPETQTLSEPNPVPAQ
jgi:hypothetical protein